jgi:hypothetical protein
VTSRPKFDCDEVIVCGVIALCLGKEDNPGRSEAIRRLVEIGLKTKK